MFKQALALPDADKWLHVTDEEIKSLKNRKSETWGIIRYAYWSKAYWNQMVFKCNIFLGLLKDTRHVLYALDIIKSMVLTMKRRFLQ